MRTAAPALILADVHTLAPQTVQAQQFLCRAVSLAHHWPGPVELWLPGPALPDVTWRRRAAMAIPANFQLHFGPRISLPLGTRKRVHAKFFFRAWVRRRIQGLARADSNAPGAPGSPLFYFRTVRFADALRPVLSRHHSRWFFEPHEVFFENARQPESFRLVEARVYAAADWLFPISNCLRRALEKSFETLPPMTPSPLGHNGANLLLPPYDPAAEPRFLYIGSLLPWKGLETAFAATAELNVVFDVVGDAGGLERSRASCAAHGYSHVRFHGEVPPEELPRFFAPGSICLLPLSRAEIAAAYTSPLKLFEYLAAGRPIVLGDVPSVREIVSDGAEARLLPVGDVAAWRHGLRQLLEDRPSATAMARRARELGERCGWISRSESIASQIAGALQESKR